MHGIFLTGLMRWFHTKIFKRLVLKCTFAHVFGKHEWNHFSEISDTNLMTNEFRQTHFFFISPSYPVISFHYLYSLKSVTVSCSVPSFDSSHWLSPKKLVQQSSCVFVCIPTMNSQTGYQAVSCYTIVSMLRLKIGDKSSTRVRMKSNIKIPSEIV